MDLLTLNGLVIMQACKGQFLNIRVEKKPSVHLTIITFKVLSGGPNTIKNKSWSKKKFIVCNKFG